METIGDRIKHFRALKGLSQKQLANRAGVTQPVIAELELGNQKASKKILDIARALGVPAESLDPDIALHLNEDVIVSTKAQDGDQISVEQAMAVAEGVILSAGLDPRHLGELRELLRECLEEPLVLSNPQSEADSRRNLTRSAFSRFLRMHAAQDATK